MGEEATGRKRGRYATTDLKRGLILTAARTIFERDGLDGASLRAIAAEAGYTPAALYFHFDSKEALYAEVLGQSLAALTAFVDAAVAGAATPTQRFRAAALAFFDFYAENPRDLDLGFYLFRGGMRPHGLGRERDRTLNEALEASLAPIREAARELGANPELADLIMADAFAHASGVLLLAHTRRIRMFGTPPRTLMERHVETELDRLQHGAR
ncbi:TetR/AcrR family transcriptional regulator [Bosea sp. (in: a-proteobacteria)]|uniref:TetR/AcrR family transcriptional regulator n=1 Tax=Bosea sp. (in: a-proteobacteria) TaxID=1871050 RepID=UPI001AC6D196|nr:TetR/AcrR family transcriptional regulator [Bosea sp. (in: a-proteobacteria)]MBN9435677.1 TetR/AcrR family transcriptional regulator [Bosea sp. (in: a-proteobacteria)]